MSDIQKLAYYQREVAKMAAFTSTATRLAGCVDPALLKAGVIGSQLQATGMINPSLARFIAEQNSIMQNIAVAQTVNSSALKAVSKAASAEEESPQTGESCEFILLKDARLETTSPVVNFPVLTVFCDQIIAVTLGTDFTNG